MHNQFRLFANGLGVLLPCLLLSCKLANAGAVPPCLKAVASKNGASLVIVEQQGDSGSFILNIFPREHWITSKDRITAPAAYWTDFLQWGIVLTPNLSSWISCPLPLITDDGEFLLLVSRDFAIGPDREALRIYRRRDHIGDPRGEGPDHGVFVRAISFQEIWPPEKIKAHQGGTDHSPAWFVGSTFDFSGDNRELVYIFEGGTLHVDLTDGAILKR